MEKNKRPIGYWIKQADIALTNGIDSLHALHGINRTGWQILHSVKQAHKMALAQLLELMQPFADEISCRKTVDELIANGWLSSDADLLYLTISGEAFYEDCFNQQQSFRDKSMQHISEQDYNVTLQTLQQIVQNLE